MILQAKNIGNIELSNGKVDITDPCYSKTARMRINNVAVRPGRYSLRYYVGKELEQEDIAETKELANQYGLDVEKSIESEKEEIKNRCFAIEMHCPGYKFTQNSPEWKEIGEIGVDAGLAGFFWNKPDFSDDEWDAFCDKLDDDKVAYLDKNMGFWCCSGYGDGIYKVYAVKDKGEIVALKICF